MISIHDNSTVTLRYLQISDGRSDRDQDGGGIFFHGTGTLLIEHSSITNNFAGYGGGLDLSGDGGELDATLQNGTTVTFNTAQYDGGGIRVGGDAHLFVLGTAASISFNTADGVENVSTGAITGGNGGGLAVFAPAQADIGSGALAVFANAAVHGGGIAALGSDISNSVVGAVACSRSSPGYRSASRATAPPSTAGPCTCATRSIWEATATPKSARRASR